MIFYLVARLVFSPVVVVRVTVAAIIVRVRGKAASPLNIVNSFIENIDGALLSRFTCSRPKKWLGKRHGFHPWIIPGKKEDSQLSYEWQSEWHLGIEKPCAHQYFIFDSQSSNSRKERDKYEMEL